MMAWLSEAVRVVLSRHVGTCRVERRPRPSHCAAEFSARSVVTGSYGLIVLLTLTDKNHNLGMDQPAQWQDSRQPGLRPFASAAFRQHDAAGRCSSFEPLSLSSIVEEVPFGANFSFMAVCCPYIAAS